MVKVLKTFSLDMDVAIGMRSIHNQSRYVNDSVRRHLQIDNLSDKGTIQKELEITRAATVELENRLNELSVKEQEIINQTLKRKEEKELEEANKIKEEQLLLNKSKEELLELATLEELKQHLDDKDFNYGLRNRYYDKFKKRIPNEHFKKILEEAKALQ